VRRAAQALVGLQRLVDMMTGMVLCKLYTQPYLPKETNQPLGDRVELRRRREGVQWEDVERVVDVFCRSEMEKMWKLYCGKVESEGSPLNANDTSKYGHAVCLCLCVCGGTIAVCVERRERMKGEGEGLRIEDE
jgi:hypothetical protein